MGENISPELSFFTKGDLFRLMRKDPLNAVNIASSILLGRQRDFSRDSERLTRSLESANVLGIENIPLEHTPIIIACNHPDIYDLLVGTVYVTQAFNKQRGEHNLPGEIHWMVAQNIPPREVMKKPAYRTMYDLIDWGLRKLNHTYGFIPVPISRERDDPHAQTQERRKALILARRYLRDSAGSVTIGIFPEGDITTGNALGDFYKGIAVLAQPVGTRDVLVLPTGIYRDDLKKLTVEFGRPLTVDRAEDVETITDKVRKALELVSKKS